jgi:hypothetical protein
MRWPDVRKTHPNRWVVIEALDANTKEHRRVVDRMAVVEVCAGGAAALQRYRELHQAHPDREFYFAHTGNDELEIVERPWIGVRRSDATYPAR